MNALILAVLALVALSGCVSAQEAYYRRPRDPQTLKCDRTLVVVPDLLHAPVAIQEGYRYADCKTRLEGAGYVRVEPDPAALFADEAVRPWKYRSPDGQEIVCGKTTAWWGGTWLRTMCIREAEERGWPRIE